jgi:hypothetical protein
VFVGAFLHGFDHFIAFLSIELVADFLLSDGSQ